MLKERKKIYKNKLKNEFENCFNNNLLVYSTMNRFIRVVVCAMKTWATIPILLSQKHSYFIKIIHPFYFANSYTTYSHLSHNYLIWIWKKHLRRSTRNPSSFHGSKNSGRQGLGLKCSRPKKMDDVSHQEEALNALRRSVKEGNVFVFRHFLFSSFLICSFMVLPEQVKHLQY